jgi:amino acid transporter
VILLATLAFVAPVAVWWRYSGRIVSSGGLYSFVEAAAGRRVALAQGAVWTVSYALYLPYTITYIVYDLLPEVFPGIHPYRGLLEVTLPLVVTAVAVLRLRTTLLVAGALAAAQLVVLALLLVVGLVHLGAPGGAFAAHGSTGTLLHGSLNVSLLYVCSSLPLFLGGETAGGSRTVQRGLVIGFGVAAVAVLLGSLVWARAGAPVLTAPIPGMALAQQSWNHSFAVVVGLGAVASVGGVVLAEYVALARLLHAMTGRSTSRTNAAVGAGFIVASLLSLINPDAFYSDLVKPSLVALWVSQIVVFVVYPLWERRQVVPARSGGRWGNRGTFLGLAAGATALMGYGLYSGLTLVSGT